MISERRREQYRRYALEYYYRNRDKCIRKITRRQKEAGSTPQRRARSAVSNALRDGRLVRPERGGECGAGGRITAHHPDYSQPLEVEWLCTRCHGKKHQQDDSKAAA